MEQRRKWGDNPTFSGWVQQRRVVKSWVELDLILPVPVELTVKSAQAYKRERSLASQKIKLTKQCVATLRAFCRTHDASLLAAGDNSSEEDDDDAPAVD